VGVDCARILLTIAIVNKTIMSIVLADAIFITPVIRMVPYILPDAETLHKPAPAVYRNFCNTSKKTQQREIQFS
jgi:hypothetical protein